MANAYEEPKYHEQRNADGTISHEGPLGSFTYDPNEFELQKINVPASDEFEGGSFMALRYVGTETNGSNIQIPNGIKDVSYMFMNRDITSMPHLPNSAEDAYGMCAGCKSLLTADAALPKSLKRSQFMFMACDNLQQGPAFVSSENADYMFAGCRAMKNTPKLANGMEHADYMFYECDGLSQQPTVPKTMRSCENMTHGCGGIDAAVDIQKQAQLERERAKYEKKLSKPSIAARMGSVFSALMQCHAMRQMGYGFLAAPMMTHQMRKSGQFSKDMAGGLSAMAMSSKNGVATMLAGKMRANADKTAEKRNIRNADKMATWDNLRGHNAKGTVSDTIAVTRAKFDMKRGYFTKMANNPPDASVEEERYGGTYGYREDLMQKVASCEGGVTEDIKKNMSDWYQTQMSSCVAYYAEGLRAIEHGDTYQTPVEKAQAIAGLHEISRIQMKPLIQSAERMQNQFSIFNEGDLRTIAKMTHDMPYEREQAQDFAQRVTPDQSTMSQKAQQMHRLTREEKVRRTMHTFEEQASEQDTEYMP